VLVDPGAVSLGKPLAGDPLRRILGMQVEGKPLDAGAEPALQPVGPLETDEAERSDVIRPNGHGEFGHQGFLPFELEPVKLFERRCLLREPLTGKLRYWSPTDQRFSREVR
jgi:hypothetical protein